MFTGLIEEIGTVKSAVDDGDGRRFTIAAALVMDDLAVDDSISINGCCLTVTERTSDTFNVTAISETLSKTTVGALTDGNAINLERAVRAQDRLGGHMVQGHVDTTGTVI